MSEQALQNTDAPEPVDTKPTGEVASPTTAPSAPPTPAGPLQAAIAPQEVAPPQPAPDAPYKHPDFVRRVTALIKGEAKPIEGTQELVDDLKACAQKQDEARQALQQVSQFGQNKQAEIFGLEGQADALVKVLYRAEKAAK